MIKVENPCINLQSMQNRAKINPCISIRSPSSSKQQPRAFYARAACECGRSARKQCGSGTDDRARCGQASHRCAHGCRRQARGMRMRMRARRVGGLRGSSAEARCEHRMRASDARHRLACAEVRVIARKARARRMIEQHACGSAGMVRGKVRSNAGEMRAACVRGAGAKRA